ncbi:aldehyde dehydrogenase family protein [Microbacterium aurantiacum]|uniref:Aldehyde dehydrogenase family protein n=1 Tax=Microbacterium aurantiacum TaxID=162393 RepID=A0AAJ2HBD0_9MICO|nr:aldehyde dehydrogenase family protein [Microbacterium aurantiacum]MDS0244337.1 aldehyde dehydrogenase family protein [Microbacterium aurantiacum]
MNAADNRLDITHNYIGGVWIAPSTATTADVFDSNTGEVMGSAPLSDGRDVERAVAAAENALEGWRNVSGRDRAQYLRAIARELEARHDQMASLIAREVGANAAISAGSQTLTPVMSFDIAADIAETYAFTESLGDNLIVREPIGVVGAITAWNFPLHLVTVKAAFAIAAGNTVVVKPSEVAPLTAAVFAEVLHTAGLPAGVINVVFGNGPDVGEPLVAHPTVRMISFTGSTRAGRRIGELAAQKVAKVALELGGKSPLVILPDAPFEEAVRFGVEDLLLNNGQRCDGYTRMIVPRDRLGEVEKLAADMMSTRRVGPSSSEQNEIGPLASQAQKDRVRSYIETGIHEGAKLVVGGPEDPELTEENRGGYFVRPTVFSEVTPEMTIAREEIFGPVLSIQAYDDVEDAVRLANDTEYGLAAAVYSGDRDWALAVASRIEAGMISVNGGGMDIRAPFGGYKQSGLGREFGHFGFEEFLEVKAVRLPA